MKSKFLDSMNYILCAFVGFTALFLLGCPALVQVELLDLGLPQSSYGAFSLFNLASYAKESEGLLKVGGSLAAAGVFNVFVLIFALLLLAIGVFMILKKTNVFDWKLDSKIENFDLIVKIIFSVYTFFTFMSVLMVGIFAGANTRTLTNNSGFFAETYNINYNGGGGTATIFVFAALACAAMWLVPVIMKAVEDKKSGKSGVVLDEDDAAEELQPDVIEVKDGDVSND